MTNAQSLEPDWQPNRRDIDWTCDPVPSAPYEFHRGLTGYAPTALVDLPELAQELGVGRVLAKDESNRFSLPAFKALGASWALHRALESRSGDARDRVSVVTATDGNHGRAVAHFARLAGHPSRIFIPAGGVHPSAVMAIRAEGAEIVEVAGSYDDCVRAAAASASEQGDVLVQDTAWDDYRDVPTWIVEGYTTMFTELDAQLGILGAGEPDAVFVPTGVGSLLQAALAHYRARDAVPGTAVIAVEPSDAACVAASLRVGRPVSVDTPGTIMSGLNCGTPSSLAWPFIHHGLDAAVAVADAEAVAAGHRLAEFGVAAGPCGAAALAGAQRALLGDDAAERRRHLGVNATSTLVLTITESIDANPLD
ncbi:pyridoxal-phosphate dependent enzyme [Brevibacterium moorei]|uniref:pyridoxal-phosphate dependent enzyme n=1 Tax=Brevibacterium moorei TaxID=2968457 RepID=UPI00211BD7E7|nr:pyridoxal-phosphate dependent enzyme [Brevibacterium sp. 68QC2CO]MCQ9385464.1 pyridoxal-phosphate dependent enzyme [Brevibacterium sp. 68QC2CO]